MFEENEKIEAVAAKLDAVVLRFVKESDRKDVDKGELRNRLNDIRKLLLFLESLDKNEYTQERVKKGIRMCDWTEKEIDKLC